MTKKDIVAQNAAQDQLEKLGKNELRADADQRLSEIKRIESEYQHFRGTSVSDRKVLGVRSLYSLSSRSREEEASSTWLRP